jgi:hypothetical protein
MTAAGVEVLLEGPRMKDGEMIDADEIQDRTAATI